MATLEKLRRHEDIALPETDPCHVVQKAFTALLAEGKRSPELVPLLAEPLNEEHPPFANIDMLDRRLKPQRDRARAHQAPIQWLADLVSVLELSAEGDDALGHRVVAKFPNPSIPQTTWFVIREQGDYRLWNPGKIHANLGAKALQRLEKQDPDAARRLLNWAWQEHKAEIGWFKVFAGSPFARLWSGQAEAPAIRTAAAALLAHGRQPEQAIKILLKARDDASTARELQIDRALGLAYLNADRPKEAIEVADRMLAKYPRVLEPYSFKAHALWKLAKNEEVGKLAEARLQRIADDPWALNTLGISAGNRGDFDAAEKHWQRLKGLDEASPEVLRRLAWCALRHDPMPDWVLEDALEANQQTQFTDPFSLYTLAAVHAELGKTNEARQALLLCIEARDASQPDPDDWYVLGRIAEQYALSDIAAAAYRKVAVAKVPSALTPYARAQKRLEALGN